MFDKNQIVASLIDQMRAQYQRSLSALQNAHEAATGEDSQAEGKYDTRGLEASYLAAGQAEQADELGKSLHAVENYVFREFEFDEAVAMGAIVECDQDGELLYYILSPGGGGIICEEQAAGVEITVLGPESPLYGKLLGKSVGQSTEAPMILTVMEVF